MKLLDTIYSLLQKWRFLFSQTNREQQIAYEILSIISQWLNQNPDYNIDKFTEKIISFEENLIIELDKFDDIQKELIFIYCRIILDLIMDIEVPFYIQEDNVYTLSFTIFVKDKKYLSFTNQILDFLEKDYYREEEIYDFFRALRKNEFKKYSWKTAMLNLENKE